MRYIRIILALLLFTMIGFYLLEQSDRSTKSSINELDNIFIKGRESLLKSKVVPEMPVLTNGGELFEWIGKSSEELVEQLGDPIRKDKSAYHYTWWVYSNDGNQYLQFGIQEDEIQTIFATGERNDMAPIEIGQSRQAVQDALATIKTDFQYEKEVAYEAGVSSYRFQLSEEDFNKRPLIKLTDNLFLQTYFDTFTNQLSSVRIMTGDVLLRHRPYGLEYRGNIPEDPSFSDEEWEEIEAGMEKQIYDMTNVIRRNHERSTLKEENSVSLVAFKHSKDMEENNYFSHYSQDGSGLKERLALEDVYYSSAGENIAAQYTDAPAAMEGWLNSEGHREALLNESYTHLGVGVYRLYYTQNFLQRPE
ncbi:CAP domain-containing protein [Oceanobacillus manasiensis]|uniref:CAP domain-containing protein n=1 Tax=Oceanobacillus manasiensis TaxID=586413 RepID=UPI0005A696E0|nr:CAP domain-containing protein [Oceanobacillus manasiensis]